MENTAVNTHMSPSANFKEMVGNAKTILVLTSMSSHSNTNLPEPYLRRKCNFLVIYQASKPKNQPPKAIFQAILHQTL